MIVDNAPQSNPTLPQTLFDYPPTADRGSFRFISGMTATSVEDDERTDWVSVAELDMSTQADRLLGRIADLTAPEGGLSSILRFHFFQKDKRYFPVLEQQRFKHEGAQPSPSSGLGLAVLTGGRDCTLEIDGLGLSPRGRQRYGQRAHQMSVGAGEGASHYAQVAGVGPYTFLAGMIPINTKTGKVPRGFDDVPAEAQWMKTGRSHPDSRIGPIASQAWTVYQQIISHLEKEDLDPSRLALVTIYLQHPGDAADAVRVHQHILASTSAAVQMVCVDEVGHKGTLLEVECTAVHADETLEASDHVGCIPRAVSAGEFVFISDCLGLSLGRPKSSITGVPDEILAVLRPADLAEATYLRQTWRALSNLRVTLEERNMEVDRHLAHLWVRIVRPYSVEKFELIRYLMFGECGHAVTISQVPAIPQSPRALMAVSAIASQETA